jgi:hypothetical protein
MRRTYKCGHLQGIIGPVGESHRVVPSTEAGPAGGHLVVRDRRSHRSCSQRLQPVIHPYWTPGLANHPDRPPKGLAASRPSHCRIRSRVPPRVRTRAGIANRSDIAVIDRSTSAAISSFDGGAMPMPSFRISRSLFGEQAAAQNWSCRSGRVGQAHRQLSSMNSPASQRNPPVTVSAVRYLRGRKESEGLRRISP